MVVLLSNWYLKKARSLPWRKKRAPYSIWISEVMLQQTQVATVIPYYERFLAAFPTVEQLALAEEEKVLSLWAGLGYYSRARNLIRGAKQIADNHGGKFPRDRDALLAIHGIGPYTAGAILSIAFDLPVPLVDGNVARVFSRYFGVRTPIDERKTMNFFWQKAEETVQKASSPRIFNQALMELGATVCTKSSPSCDLCPIRGNCVAFAKGWQQELPLKKKKTRYKDLLWTVTVLEHGDTLAIKKNAGGEWWTGLWDFPRYDGHLPPLSFCGVAEKKVGSIRELNHQKHTVTHHRLHVAPYHIKLKSKPNSKNLVWRKKSEIAELPLSALAKRILLSLS